MRITERRQRGAGIHISGNSLPANIGDITVPDHHRFAVTGELAMYVHTRTGFPGGDFRREGQLHTILVCQLEHYPFGNDNLVGGIFNIDGSELYLVLLVYLSVESEIPDLGMTVFYMTSGSGDEPHPVSARRIFQAVFLR